ncbi:MAG: hypothetical protein ACI85O_003948, partial [Saprospiraceae bacterium]
MRELKAILFLGFFCICKAQQPSYFLVGQEQFAGVDIYSIIQDSDANIWIASEDGLFKYDGYTFTPYSNVAMKTKDIFALKLDNEGSVFCSNLYGQIFKVENDSMHLFYELSGHRLSDVIVYEFDNLNQLVYCTDGYYLIDKDKKQHRILKYEGNCPVVSKGKNGEVLIMDLESDEIKFFKNNKLTSRDISLPKSLEINWYSSLLPFISNNTLTLLEKRSPISYIRTDKHWERLKLNNPIINRINCRRYTEKGGRFWLADESKGLYAFDVNGQQLYGDNILFPNYGISGMLEDREGSIWFATLGKGLIVVPNKDFIDFTNHPSLINDDIKTITVDQNNDIYFAGLKRNVYKLSHNKLKLFYKTNLISYHIKYLKNHNSLYVQMATINMKSGEVITREMNSVKDICQYSDNSFLSATNQGVDHISFGEIEGEDLVKINQFISHAQTGGRIWCIEYDSQNDKFWYQSVAGIRIYKDGESHQISIQGKPLLANDLEIFRNHMWIATDMGLYQYKDEQLIQIHSTDNGLLSNQISKIKARNGKLYIATKLGIQKYDLMTNTYQSFKKEDGLLSNQIEDFEVVGNDIWIVQATGVQKVQIEKIGKSRVAPIINFKSILVNEDDIKKSYGKKLSYDQNEIEFEFVGKYYQNKDALHYEYQLDGQDTSWKHTSYSENKLNFLSLSPGKYTFNVRAVAKSIPSETISYSFTIQSPFWKTWWFIMFSFIAILSVGLAIFRYRIQNVKKRLDLEQQLKLSEITALKAQMNPHFVFNCLNSIQALVLQKDVNVAYDYISKFAKLVRSVVHQSGEDMIDFEEEIQTLSIYLDLEKLRFKNDFEYSLDANGLSDIEIPPMLIQPFIENALKHGLLHK